MKTYLGTLSFFYLFLSPSIFGQSFAVECEEWIMLMSDSIYDELEITESPENVLTNFDFCLKKKTNSDSLTAYILKLKGIYQAYLINNTAEAILSWQSASEILEKNPKQKHFLLLRSLYYNLGNIHGYTLQNYAAAIENFSKEVELLKELKDTTKLVEAINAIADCYEGTGDFNNMISFRWKAINLLNNKADFAPQKLADLYLDQSRGYNEIAKTKNDSVSAKEAVHSARRAIRWADKKLSEIDYENFIAKAYFNIGNSYLIMEKYDSSLFYFSESKDFFIKSHTDETEYRLELLNNLGINLRRLKKYPEAEEILTEAIEQAKKENNRQMLALLHDNLGDIYQEQGKIEKALNHYQQAIVHSVIGFDKPNPEINPVLSDSTLIIPYKLDLLTYLTDKANCYKNIGTVTSLKHALNAFNAADILLNLINEDMSADQAKLFWREVAFGFYDAAIECAYDLYEKDEKYKTDLFKRSEKARAFLLLNALNIQNVGKKSKNRKIELDSVANIQSKLLNESTLFMEYFFGKKHIYALGISKNDFKIFRFEIKKENKTNLKNFLQAVESPSPNYQQYCRLGFELYQYLFQPVLEAFDSKINSVIIAPDGQLNYLPFEALLTKPIAVSDGDVERWDILPYLIYDYEIRYGYSGTLLLEGLQTDSQKPLTFYGFAPEGGGSHIAVDLGDRLSKLLLNVSEIEEISSMVGGHIFKNDAAVFKKLINLSGGGCLHLSTHAVGSFENSSDDSKIFMQDTAVYISDIYKLSPFDMVVLSACQTLKGEFRPGEGNISITRAFRQSGSASVTSTLWSVEEGVTKTIMTGFYENLKVGMTKSDALRKAKLNYLNSNSGKAEKKPFYWASFVNLGNNDSVTFASSGGIFSCIGFWILGLMIVGLIIWFLKRNREK